MPYYVCNSVGSGSSTDDAFRPAGTDGVAGWQAIDLSPPTAPGWKFLVWSPTALATSNAVSLLASTAADTLSNKVLNQLQNALGVTLTQTQLQAVVVEIMTMSVQGKWAAVVAGVSGSREIHLGEINWTG